MKLPSPDVVYDATAICYELGGTEAVHFGTLPLCATSWAVLRQCDSVPDAEAAAILEPKHPTASGSDAGLAASRPPRPTTRPPGSFTLAFRGRLWVFFVGEVDSGGKERGRQRGRERGREGEREGGGLAASRPPRQQRTLRREGERERRQSDRETARAREREREKERERTRERERAGAECADARGACSTSTSWCPSAGLPPFWSA
eukprot:3938909-Rhodomonas_salina.1